MIHKNLMKSDVVLMWFDANTNKQQTIKFNRRSNIPVVTGDKIEVGKPDDPRYYHIEKILSDRPSSLSGYNYVEALATRNGIL